MRSNFLQLYVHLVWATWDRLPLIDEQRRMVIYRSILNESRRMKVDLLAIGGVEDHIHVLAQMPPNITVTDLVKQFKGKSSYLCGQAFRWQRTYGAISVCKRHVPAVTAYIQNQRTHHSAGSTADLLEKTEEFDGYEELHFHRSDIAQAIFP